IMFWVYLREGIQVFERDSAAAERGHRLALSNWIQQLCLGGFRAQGIDMRYPPFQMRLGSLGGTQTGRTLTSAGKTSRPAGRL
uniref:hypothetical protein n=1 Tax=Salmonella enterica TaxID=28901 RepID=UPI00398C5FD5